MISELNIIAVSQRTELGSKRFNFMDTFMETSKNVFIALHLRRVCIKLVNLKCSKFPNDFLIDSAEKRLKKSDTQVRRRRLYKFIPCNCSTALRLADWLKKLLLDRKCTTRQLCIWMNHLKVIRQLIVLNLKELQREINS